MKTIIAATDFSPAALNAANYAAEMALAISADMILLHIHQIPAASLEVPVSFAEDIMMEEAQETLSDIKEQLTRKTGDKIHIKTKIRTGFFFEELKNVCEALNPYTVVMGSQGVTAAVHLFFGSHTVFALKHLNCPLITVPPGAKFSLIKKIGLACDLDKVVETIPLDEIKILINDFHAELYVINCGKTDVFKPEMVFQAGILEAILAPLKPHYHFISSENSNEGIINFAEKNHIDLLIVLPKRHGLLDSLINKSHSKQLILHSHVPVMALKQKGVNS